MLVFLSLYQVSIGPQVFFLFFFNFRTSSNVKKKTPRVLYNTPALWHLLNALFRLDIMHLLK